MTMHWLHENVPVFKNIILNQLSVPNPDAEQFAHRTRLQYF